MTDTQIFDTFHSKYFKDHKQRTFNKVVDLISNLHDRVLTLKKNHMVAVKLNTFEHAVLKLAKFGVGLVDSGDTAPVYRLSSGSRHALGGPVFYGKVRKWGSKEVSPRSLEFTFMDYETDDVVDWILSNIPKVKGAPDFPIRYKQNAEVGSVPGYIWTESAIVCYERAHNEPAAAYAHI